MTSRQLARCKPKALVVGTTADYIDWIRNKCPNRALFLTDHEIRRHAQEPRPSSDEEILCDLSDYRQTGKMLEQHLLDKGLRLDGVVSYDCESMQPAAVIAEHHALPYPSVQAIENCRNKYLTKTLWQKHNLNTPKVFLAKSATEVQHFLRELGGSVVLKPLSGSGSELIFHCNDTLDCEQSVTKILNGLRERSTHRLYQPFCADEAVILSEEFVSGNEYSCDFMIENDRVTVIRLTRKILNPRAPFGTVLAYLLLGSMPAEIDERDFLNTLRQSATALGIERAICMLDFMVHQGRIVLLELAPRPGGDCIPFLLRRCRNLDIVKLFLDFSQQRRVSIPASSDKRTFIAMRLHALKNGFLKKIDTRQLKMDSRVWEIYLAHKPGHLIKIPPEDYDSWLLGYSIFEPVPGVDAASQCRELLEKLIVEIE